LVARAVAAAGRTDSRAESRALERLNEEIARERLARMHVRSERETVELARLRGSVIPVEEVHAFYAELAAVIAATGQRLLKLESQDNNGAYAILQAGLTELQAKYDAFQQQPALTEAASQHEVLPQPGA
jgi:hypothetical protein